MYHDFTYEAALAASLRAQWKLDDVLRADQELDFSRNFLPDSLAGTGSISGLTPDQRRTLNQICANEYLFFFGAFEESVVPFALHHVEEPTQGDEEAKERALLNFAEEEKKHIALFVRFREAFDRGFPVQCKLINSRALIPQAMQSAHPLAGALFVLLFEWMTQSHYLDSVRDNTNMDPLFKSLLKHHWMEEAQHAKLDTLIVDDLAAKCSPAELQKVIADFRNLFVFMNKGLAVQAGFNVDSFERAIGLRIRDRQKLTAHLHRTAVWALIGCGLVHDRFRASLESISPEFAARVDQWARQQFGPEMRRTEAARPKARRLRANA